MGGLGEVAGAAILLFDKSLRLEYYLPMSTIKNHELSRLFEEMADILEFKAENPFKINAYRKAAHILEGLTEDIEAISQEGRLQQIPGIGTGIARKIKEYLTSGKMSKYEEAKKDVPETLIDLLRIQGLGPKTLGLAHKELGIVNLLDLERTIQIGSLERLPNMGKKKVESILRGIRFFKLSQERMLLGVALPLVLEIIDELSKVKGIGAVSTCGSLRRMKETIGDIDILAENKEGERIIAAFTQLPQVKEVLAADSTKGSILTQDGVQVDLRVVHPDSFGAALQYFTGSAAHNIRLREMAKKKGLKITEYGIFKGEKKIGGKSEEDIYKTLDLPWIPPELREDWGEIEAVIEGKLPRLVKGNDILGDLHVHSNYSDGTSSIEEMAIKAMELGYRYVAICDHSNSARYAHGLTEERLLQKIGEISRLNEELKEIRILAGAEVDIMKDGSLDYSDDVLSRLDVVIAAIHQGFKQNVTERICRALENPWVDIVAHPTGRLISSREGYEVDIEKVMQKAAKTGKALEINTYYDRLDLSDIHCKRAKEFGCMFSIGSDAHLARDLEMVKFGLGVARRGWLEKEDLLNTLPLEELLVVEKKGEFFYSGAKNKV